MARTTRILSLLAAALLAASAGSASAPAGAEGGAASPAAQEAASKAKTDGSERAPYRIGVGDVLDIVVWKNPDVSRKVTVRVDGRITLPLVGEIVVEGMTTQELTQALTGKLKEFFTEPVVTVSLEEARYAPPSAAPAAGSTAASTEPGVAAGLRRAAYQIGVGDVLDIVVWKNPDVSRKLAVRMDGRITLPLVGELYVEGLTTQALTNIITERLKDFYTEPVVTVSLEEMRYSVAPRPADGAGDAGTDKGAYRIGEEDVLDVVVWKNADVSRQVWVRPDGRISLPLVGEVQAKGLTPHQLTNEIAERLRRYFTDPVVTVNVADINSYSVYLLGKFSKPGVMKLRGPKTFLQVVSMAGGFQEFADTGNIVVVRWEGGQSKRIKVDVDKIVKKDVQGDFVLQPGDVVIVP